jgi:hypothetical protein
LPMRVVIKLGGSPVVVLKSRYHAWGPRKIA